MNAFSIKTASVLAIFLLVLNTSCDQDFEEININPNAPTDVPVNLLLPGIINNMCNEVVGTGWGIGNIVIQHTAKIQFVNEDRYLWGEVNGIWNSVFGNMRNVKIIYDKATEADQQNYAAIALILKSWMFSLATDAYGEIPYSEAIRAKQDDLLFPSYDLQESIYTSILADLKIAAETIGTTNETVSGDILFGGNVSKWKKLANSLRLRYLMRISNRRDVSAEMASIVGNPAQYPIFESNADNAALKYLAAAPSQFPIHTSRVGSFDEFRLSKTLGDRLTALGDPRITVFARPTAASASTANPEYVGIPNGLDDVTALTYNGGAQNISRIGALFFEDAITDAGRNVAKGVVMTYPELQFILAEAAQKGLISGDAKTYYEKGVTASFEYFGVTMPADYLTQAGVAFTAGNELDVIAEQKWISLFFHGLEAWFDWRRTGKPTITPGPSNLNANRVPVRFIYPLSEQSLNADKRAEAVDRQGADDINTQVWWDK